MGTDWRMQLDQDLARQRVQGLELTSYTFGEFHIISIVHYTPKPILITVLRPLESERMATTTTPTTRSGSFLLNRPMYDQDRYQ